MKYSSRILKTVDLLMPGNILADIGCDHGYMSLLSVETGKAGFCYACDVSPGPLGKAESNIREKGYEDRIKTILSDGFACVPSGADRAVICGMGGELIRRILESGKEKTASVAQMILGPHSEVPELRRYLIEESSFTIYSETVLSDAGKYYVLLDVRPKKDVSRQTGGFYSRDCFLDFGDPGNQKDLPMFLNFLNHERSKLESALKKTEESSGNRAADKNLEIRNRIKNADEVICLTVRKAELHSAEKEK